MFEVFPLGLVPLCLFKNGPNQRKVIVNYRALSNLLPSVTEAQSKPKGILALTENQ